MIVQEKKATKNILSDILLAVKWSHISTHYFSKSRSWFSQRLNGYDGNHSANKFSDNERELLKESLFDLSERIRKCAENL